MSRKKREAELASKLIGNNLISYTNSTSITAEQFRSLRTNIEFSQLNKNIKSILITSSIPGEGKSTIAANLAYMLAQTNKKILLVDTDLRKPTIHKRFKLKNKFGLTNLLLSSKPNYESAIIKNNKFGLDFLTSGPIPPNPSELLSSIQMNALIEELNDMYDLVIYDAPPVTSVSDPQILATKLDSVILVTRYGYVKKESIKLSIETLNKVNANILGYVMNAEPVLDKKSYYAYYGKDEKKNEILSE